MYICVYIWRYVQIDRQIDAGALPIEFSLEVLTEFSLEVPIEFSLDLGASNEVLAWRRGNAAL